MPTFDELQESIRLLKEHRIETKDLPMGNIVNAVLAQGNVDPNELLVPHMIGYPLLKEEIKTLIDSHTTTLATHTANLGLITPAIVTALPGSPVDGQQCIFDPSGWTITGTAEALADVQWHLRYRTSTTKWHFIGGDPIVVRVDTSENRAVAAAYAALATAGPGITAAIAGDYLIQVGSTMGTIAAFTGNHSYDVGGTGAVDADSAQLAMNAVGNGSVISTPRRKNVAAATNFLSKYKATTNVVGFGPRWMSLLPVRMG